MVQAYQAPSDVERIAEQTAVQAEKQQTNLLSDYDRLMFAGQQYVPRRDSAVVDFVRARIGHDEPVTFQRLLQAVVANKPQGQVCWADMCGGVGLAARQMACVPGLTDKLRAINVDILGHGLETIPLEGLNYLEEITPGVTQPQAAPELLRDNVETVILPTRPDVISCVEGIQYLHDPLRALVNSYNQLTDNGIMIIATEHEWPRWIAYDSDLFDGIEPVTPITHFIEDLQQNDINFAATHVYDSMSGTRPELDSIKTRVLMIERKPGTRLRVAKCVVDVFEHYKRYKAIAYEDPTADSPHAIEIIHDQSREGMGRVALSYHD